MSAVSYCASVDSRVLSLQWSMYVTLSGYIDIAFPGNESKTNQHATMPITKRISHLLLKPWDLIHGT